MSVEENNVLYPRALCPKVTNAAAVVYLEESMLGIKNQDPQQEAQQKSEKYTLTTEKRQGRLIRYKR